MSAVISVRVSDTERETTSNSDPRRTNIIDFLYTLRSSETAESEPISETIRRFPQRLGHSPEMDLHSLHTRNIFHNSLYFTTFAYTQTSLPRRPHRCPESPAAAPGRSAGSHQWHRPGYALPCRRHAEIPCLSAEVLFYILSRKYVRRTGTTRPATPPLQPLQAHGSSSRSETTYSTVPLTSLPVLILTLHLPRAFLSVLAGTNGSRQGAALPRRT